MSNTKAKAFSDNIHAQIKFGKVRESNSKIAAGVFYVPKKDTGGDRLVVDYQKLNYIIKPNQFPMPSQVDLLEKIQDAKVITKLDLQWGFNNIHIREGNKWKTAFRSKAHFCKYTVMPFGLKNVLTS